MNIFQIALHNGSHPRDSALLQHRPPDRPTQGRARHRAGGIHHSKEHHCPHQPLLRTHGPQDMG